MGRSLPHHTMCRLRSPVANGVKEGREASAATGAGSWNLRSVWLSIQCPSGGSGETDYGKTKWRALGRLPELVDREFSSCLDFAGHSIRGKFTANSLLFTVPKCRFREFRAEFDDSGTNSKKFTV